MTKFSVFFISVLIATTAFAEDVCFNTLAEHAKVKNKLPELFQILPISLGANLPGRMIDIFVLLKIQSKGNSIVFKSDIYASTQGRTADETEVKNICYNPDTKSFEISFNTKAKVFKVAVMSVTSVLTEGVILKKIGANEHKEILEKLEGKGPATTSSQVEK